MTRHSLHIAVAKPLWGSYEEIDMLPQFEAARRVAKKCGFKEATCSTADETKVEAVDRALKDAVNKVKNGGDLFITFAGHGVKHYSPPPTTDPNDDDEYWVLSDGELCDNVWINLWKQCSADTRIVMVADHCYGLGAVYPPGPLWSRFLRSKVGRVFDSFSFFQPEIRHCPTSDVTAHDQIKAGIVVIASGNTESSPTRPGLTTAFETAMEQNPADFKELASLTQTALQKKYKDRLVHALPTGMGGDALLRSKPLA